MTEVMTMLRLYIYDLDKDIVQPGLIYENGHGRKFRAELQSKTEAGWRPINIVSESEMADEPLTEHLDQ